MRVDLHLHTTASDGSLTPTRLVSQASETGLDIIAITDHDTTAGLKEAYQAASSEKVRSLVVIPGIELSAEDSVPREGGGLHRIDVHTLGYFVDLENADFQAQLERFRSDRLQRGQRIVERLADIGMPVDWQRVIFFAQGGSIGRPHIARAMIEAGYVASVKEAFDKYIGTNGPAYVARKRLSPEEAVAFVHAAGGVAVLAHPGVLPDYVAMVKRLVPAGLDGVEVIHPKNDETTQKTLWALAEEHGLIKTGGSDFHGPAVDPTVTIGCVVPPEGCVEALRERAKLYSA
jgi:3',5'-nucleoside bisphosphate phosphatase